MPENEADKWLAKIQQEKKGKLKIYIGMSAVWERATACCRKRIRCSAME